MKSLKRKNNYVSLLFSLLEPDIYPAEVQKGQGKLYSDILVQQKRPIVLA